MFSINLHDQNIIGIFLLGDLVIKQLSGSSWYLKDSKYVKIEMVSFGNIAMIKNAF